MRARLNKELALQTLKDTKRVLDGLGVEFFLNYGTCLGAVREHDFIDEDTDIDLGIIGNERFDEIKTALLKDGFTFKIDGKKVYYYFPARKQVPIDIFVYRESGEYLQSWVSYQHPWLFFPKRFGKMEKIKFKGMSFNVPSPVEEFLTWVYDDWKVKADVSANDNWTTKK